MDGARVRSIVIFVLSVFLLIPGNIECKRKLAEALFEDGININCIETNQDKAGEVWIHCRKEMKDSKKAVEDFVLHLPQAITDLPSDMKQTLLDFLRNKTILLHVSGKEVGSKALFNECLQLLYGWPKIPRRYLKEGRSHHHHRKKGSSASSQPRVILPDDTRTQPSPTPPIASSQNSQPSEMIREEEVSLPVPELPANTSQPLVNTSQPLANTSDPSVASDLWRRLKHRRGKAPKKSPIPVSEPPAETPESSPPISEPLPKSQPMAKTPEPSLVQDLNESPHPSAAEHPPVKPPVGPPHPSEKKSSSQKYIIAAVSGTAVAAIALVALLLICCLKNKRKMDSRDEKPLLNLSDISGSSNISVGNASNKDFKTLSLKNSNAMAESQSSEATPEVNVPAPAPPPPPPPKPPAPRPPPPPKAVRPPPIPGKKAGNTTKPSPLGPNGKDSSSGDGDEGSSETDARKTKLKPLFWDKVPANPDSSMVWHELKAGSFQFNEEAMENLFGYTATDKNKNEQRKDLSSLGSTKQYIQIIDAKKSQNLAIILKALNVTIEEVLDALMEGNELPAELVQTLLKMAPTTEEELKLRLFSGDISELGPAERFLKVMVDIPFAFKRLEALLFMSFYQGEASSIKESFTVLEVACKELKNSRLFLKLLEAVLKTGNRMNDGTFRGDAQAFKLDTLLKLSDVKGTDGKTTLLHFVVQEIIRSEGIRAARRARENKSMSSASSLKSDDFVEDPVEETEEYHRSLGLQVVSELSTQLENVRKAAVIDGDSLTATVSKLDQSLSQCREFLNNDMKTLEEESKFHDTLASFVERSEAEITSLVEEEKSIMVQVKSTVDYFHGNAGKDEGLRLFGVVRDFLVMVDKTCNEVKKSVNARTKSNYKKEGSSLTASPSRQVSNIPLQDVRQQLFPAIKNLRINGSSSDDEDFSP